jgi:hypothetical protein
VIAPEQSAVAVIVREPLYTTSYESSPNVISHSMKSHESPRIIIPQKEKEFYIRSEQRNRIPKLSSKLKGKIPFIKNKNYNTFSNELNTEENNYKENKENMNEKEGKPLFRKIKVKKMNNIERIFTIPSCNSIRPKNAIDINNYYPNSVKRDKNLKQINGYEFNNDKKILVNKNFNLTNITPKNKNSSNIFNTKIGNKYSLKDKNDDIINTQPNNDLSSETNDNRKILQNIKNEIDKAKSMIINLKSQNKKLKNRLNQKEKYNTISSDKEKTENNLNLFNENKEEKLEKDVISLKNEIKEIMNKLEEYENFIALLKKRNSEQEHIIENKNKEILELMIKIGNFEKSKNINDSKQEKLNISIDEYKNMNENLKKEILKLKLSEENKNEKIKELEINLKFEKNYSNKKQKILELLFNFYTNLKKVINYDKPKESLQSILDVITLDDFKLKLNKVEKKIIQVIEDIQIKYGHCFACDIACCTSRVDKLKNFRKKINK